MNKRTMIKIMRTNVLDFLPLMCCPDDDYKSREEFETYINESLWECDNIYYGIDIDIDGYYDKALDLLPVAISQACDILERKLGDNFYEVFNSGSALSAETRNREFWLRNTDENGHFIYRR